MRRYISVYLGVEGSKILKYILEMFEVSDELNSAA
jgi:hypothetical protein